MTIYDIAQEAGVSASMVSRVIYNRNGVAPEKRKRILELLEKYHYVPNEMARSLVTNNTRMVGILATDIRHEHQLTGAHSITRELAKCGYSGWICNCGGGDEERVAGIRDMARRNVQAAVLMSSTFQSRAVEKTIAKYMNDIPVLILNGCLELPNVYGVMADIRGGMRDCVRRLLEKGKRRIVLVNDAPIPTTKQKEQGYLAAMQEAGRGPAIIQPVPSSFEGGYDAVERMLTEYPDVDAVVCAQDIMACGVIRALWERKIPIPDAVSVVGCDNTTISQIYIPKLTTLDTMLNDCSATIAHKLIDCLEDRGTNKRTVLMTSLIERETT